MLKDAQTSANEFEWQVNVADEKKYDEINRQYGSYLIEDQRIALRKMLKELADLVVKSCNKFDNKVLDIATGMGTFVLPLAERTSADTLIVGTDIDEKPLRGAMSKAKKAHISDKLSLVVTDAKHMSFMNNSFSTISSNFGFNNIPETVLAFKECARVLEPEGNVIFSSLWFNENSESARLAEERNLAQITSEVRLRKTLKQAELVVDWIEEAYSGVWPHNPMDLLPVEGDAYAHVIVQARRIS